MGGVCSSSAAASAASAGDGYRSLAARVATSAKTGQLDASALGIARLDELRDGLHARTRAINVSRNRLADLGGLGAYPLAADKLQKLNVSLNPQLAGLPPLAGFVALVALDAHGCDLRGGDSVPSLPPRLRELDLSGNPHLARPPRCVWALAELRVLRLAGTGLAALPVALTGLVALTELVVDDNPQLESLALVGGDSDGKADASTAGAVVSVSGSSESDGDGDDSGGGSGWAALPRLTTLSARNCRLRPEPSSLPRALLADSAVTALRLGGNPGLTPRALLALPGMDAYVGRRKRALDRGMTGDGGGRLSLAGDHW
jgi:Leucine-rich repeat (LRR) protein